MNKAVIALGSNIDPEENISAALQLISNAFLVVEKSTFIYTEPVGYKDQPDFLNGVVLIESSKDKSEIISALKQIETDLGRQRDGRKDGPRRIDLDLLWHNNQIIDEDIYERGFLQRSIQEVLPEINLATGMK